jgi:two-component system, NarL family, sensor histidine kinase FusK
MLPVTVLLALISHLSSMANPQLVLMMLFLPVAWLTVRHGWRATAFGTTVAILSAAFVLPSEAWGADVEVVETELFLAITLTSLFALGARISVQAIEGRGFLDESKNVKYQAQQSYLHGEQRIRQTAQALEYLAGTLHVTNGRLLQQLRRTYPHIETEGFYKEALAAHNQVYQLAENLHPLAWRERGLPAALQETIGRALNEAGLVYHCTIQGRGFSRIQTAVLSAVYRAACEAVVYVASRPTCSSVNLIVRGGETNGARWIYVCAEGSLDNTNVVRSIHALSDRRRIASRLGATVSDLDELRDRLHLFDGDLRERTGDVSLRVAMLFHDPTEVWQRRADASAKSRLWVR